MSYDALGEVWSVRGFAAALFGSVKPGWVRGITIHHTARPCLRTRTKGLTMVHMENIKDFYAIDKGWSSGPHLFADDDQLWGLTPLTEPGSHARSFNGTHVGIEVLGDYDVEEADYGRGWNCWNTCAAAVAVLLKEWDLPFDAVNFHRDDPKTDKTCPGRRISKKWFLDLVAVHKSGHSPVATLEITHTMGTTMVPVAAYVATLGLSEKLETRDGSIYLGEWRLETAHYDKVMQTTSASRHELEQWAASRDLKRKVKP